MTDRQVSPGSAGEHLDDDARGLAASPALFNATAHPAVTSIAVIGL